MADKRKIIDARANESGNIEAVLLEGNTTYTSLKKAITMTEQNQVDAVVVNQKNGNQYLRTRPDKKTENNLDDMAQD
jgi:Protein of unknown function (DUF3892)